MKNETSSICNNGFSICWHALIPFVNSIEPSMASRISRDIPISSRGYCNVEIKVAKNTTQAHIMSIACAECEIALTTIFEKDFFS